ITYTLTVTEDTCIGTDEVVLNVNPLPTVAINPAGPFCESAAAVTLSATPGGGQWTGDVIGNMFHPMLAGPGIHSVTYAYTDNNGCTNSATMDIEVYSLPSITIDPSPAEFC